MQMLVCEPRTLIGERRAKTDVYAAETAAHGIVVHLTWSLLKRGNPASDILEGDLLAPPPIPPTVIGFGLILKILFWNCDQEQKIGHQFPILGAIAFQCGLRRCVGAVVVAFVSRNEKRHGTPRRPLTYA